MLLTLYDNRRFKQPNEILGRNRKNFSLVHHADRTHALKPQLLRQQSLAGVPVHSNHEVIATTGGKIEKPHVARMYDVKVARDKNNAAAGRTLRTNARQDHLHALP